VTLWTPETTHIPFGDLSSAVHSPLSVASFTDDAVSDDLLGDHPVTDGSITILVAIDTTNANPVRVEQGSHHRSQNTLNTTVTYPIRLLKPQWAACSGIHSDVGAIPTGQNLPRLTLPQQRLLDCNMAESRTIDRALAKVDSWPSGRAPTFRTLRLVLLCSTKRLYAPGQFGNATQELQESIDQLSRSNIYVHIQQALEDENDEFTWLATSNLCAMMKKIVRRLVESADSYCRCVNVQDMTKSIVGSSNSVDSVALWTRYKGLPYSHRLCSVSTGCHVPLDHSTITATAKPGPITSTIH